MVDPPPQANENVTDKNRLRNEMRVLRREHVAALPESAKALMFRVPPRPVASLVQEGAIVGLYHARGAETPTRAYAEWFLERGHVLALPWFADRDAPLQFRAWRNPFIEDELVAGPFGIAQPLPDAQLVTPDIAFVPVTAFTARCDRLGHGGGHYDRWLAANPRVTPIGLAWDCQLVDSIPEEPHDQRMHMIVTPTRLFERTE